ncbi:MAG: cupredoxin domain-containing protein [Kouleothrix sp.]|nr:cupredoxin domain-containing protein [Kouleothrix sp.]
MPKAIIGRLFQALVLGGMLTLAACGGSKAPPAAADPKPPAAAQPAPAPTARPIAVSAAKPSPSGAGKPATVQVKLKTYGVTSDTSSVKAGEVTFNVTNTATDLEHEMLVVRTDLAPDALPYDAGINQLPEDKINSLGEVSELRPGNSGSVTLKLEPGKYLLLCNILSHFKHGMVTPLVVTP